MHRIFIVGFPRSGTTLLQSLMGAHPDLITFPESHLLSKSFRLPKRYFPFFTRKSDHIPIVHEFLTACKTGLNIDMEAQVNLRILEKRFILSSYNMAKLAIELYDSIAKKNDHSGWIEKTPEHLYYSSQFSFVKNNVKFIHVVRSPIHAVTSYVNASKKWSPHPVGIYKAGKRWDRALRWSLSCVGRKGHHFITYENLVSEPHALSERLAAKLGLTESPGFSHNYRAVARKVILDSESHKSENLKSIRSKDRPETLLDLDVVRNIENCVTEKLYLDYVDLIFTQSKT